MCNKKKIVIVEDERIIAEDIKASLLFLGYEVLAIFSKGEELLANVSALRPDLVLMDIMLAGDLNGIETAERLRQILSVPIIYLTAYSNSEFLAKAKITTPFGYLIKPFEERELHATLEMAFYRVELEEDIRLTKANYNALFKSIRNPIFILDKHDLKILNWNDRALDLYGYSEQELPAKSIFDLSEESDHQQIKKAFQKEASSENILFRQFDKSRNELFVNFSIQELIYEKTPTWLCIIQDRSLQLLTEKKFEVSRSRLSAIIQNVPNIVLYEIGLDRRFISENITVLIKNTSDNPIRNKADFFKLLHPDDRYIVQKKIQQWVRNGKKGLLTIWYRVDNKAGKFIWIEDRLVEVIPEDGNRYISGVLIDNTNLKEAEFSLRKSHSRYRAIVEDQTEFICRFNTDFVLTFVNEAFCRFFRKMNSDCVGQNWLEVVQPVNQKEVISKVNSLSIKNPSNNYEFWLNDSSGKRFFTEWIFRMIFNDEGEFIEYQAVGRDSTIRKNIEEEKETIREQLYQSQKMEVLGKLAGGIAHDFNNLLTAINGYADMAIRKSDSDSNLLHDLKIIKDCGEKAARLTQQLLGFSRKQIVQQNVIDLNEIIEKLLDMLNKLIGENIELILSLTGEPAIILADASQIEQVMINLIVNARDAMPNGGQIIIETHNEAIAEDHSYFPKIKKIGNFVMISVKDNGTGIADDVLEKIFEPFFTTKEFGKGTGLGLATVYGIIKQNNGFIFVNTKPGLGSEFIIFLPQSAGEVSHPENKPKSEPQIKAIDPNKTILLVEDEDTIREFITSLLEEFHFKILSARNGEEGLELAVENEFDLLLTDVRMPRMSGVQLAEKLKSDKTDLRVIFMSGHSDDELTKKALQKSDTYFLQKPFSYEQLIEKISQVFGD